MKRHLLLTLLLTLPLLAEAPNSALTCDDTRMEQSVAHLKTEAEKGDAYSQRQLYL